MRGWKGETDVVKGTNFTSRFDIDEIMQICWFGFVKEIVSNRYDFVLCIFNLLMYVIWVTFYLSFASFLIKHFGILLN